MKGRKPQPADVKVANGKRPINVNAPRYDALDTATPDELVDPVARAEWDRIAPLLAARGHATIVDRATLIAYCLKYAQWIALETAAASGGFLVKRLHGPVANPLINLANRAYALFMKAAVELGVTPSQRPRIVGTAAPAAAVDPFTEFQRTRPTRVARVG